MSNFNIRKATPEDTPTILHLITQLAIYEKLEHEVITTVEELRENIFEKKYAEVLIAEEDQNEKAHEKKIKDNISKNKAEKQQSGSNIEALEESEQKASQEEIISSFLQQYYINTSDIPSEIIIPFEIEKKEKLFKEEIKHLKRMSDLEIEKAQTICNSTIEKIETMVKAIGKETLVELARAGPETQAKILKSLGVKSFLITDGKNPINLFNTSNGLMGGAP